MKKKLYTTYVYLGLNSDGIGLSEVDKRGFLKFTQLILRPSIPLQKSTKTLRLIGFELTKELRDCLILVRSFSRNHKIILSVSKKSRSVHLISTKHDTKFIGNDKLL